MNVRKKLLKVKKEMLDEKPTLRGTRKFYSKYASRLKKEHELLRVIRRTEEGS
tara:strand:- start:64 stop:222 length:159 start_codon:yes stop_codon:yes gene_type:complete